MTNKEFKDEVFSRAEKQITKRKKTIKAIWASALSVALLAFAIPFGLSFFSKFALKGDMAGYDRNSGDQELSPSCNDDKPDKGYEGSAEEKSETDTDSPSDIECENLEIFDYSIGDYITTDSTQKKEIVGILKAMITEVLQKGSSITASELSKNVANGTYRLKIIFSETEFYIGESTVCFKLKELNCGDYLNNMLKIIEK